jgi:uncharacterized membrane protein
MPAGRNMVGQCGSRPAVLGRLGDISGSYCGLIDPVE